MRQRQDGVAGEVRHDEAVLVAIDDEDAAIGDFAEVVDGGEFLEEFGGLRTLGNGV
jgi:hypothetical protein